MHVNCLSSVSRNVVTGNNRIGSVWKLYMDRPLNVNIVRNNNLGEVEKVVGRMRKIGKLHAFLVLVYENFKAAEHIEVL